MDLSVGAQKMVFDITYTEEENLVSLAKEKLSEINKSYADERKKVHSFKNTSSCNNVLLILSIFNMLAGSVFLLFVSFQMGNSLIRTITLLFGVFSIIITVVNSIKAIVESFKDAKLRELYFGDTKEYKINTVSINNEDRYKNLLSNPNEQYRKDLFINILNNSMGSDLPILKGPHDITVDDLRVAYSKLQQDSFRMLIEYEKVRVIILKAFKDNI